METIPHVFAAGNGCAPCWQEYRITPPNSSPQGITSDGTYLWFTQFNSNQIEQMGTTGSLRPYSIPTPNSGPSGITSDGNGNIWFTEFNSNKIGLITPKCFCIGGEYPIPTPNSGPMGITTGSDGNIWFTEFNGSKIASLTPTTGVIKEYRTPTSNSGPMGVTRGPDGYIWFTEFNSNKIGYTYDKVTCIPRGECYDGIGVREYPIPTLNSKPYGITSDGTYLWFTENQASQIVRMTTSGSISSYPTQNLNSGPMGIIYDSGYGCIVFTEFNSGDMGFIGTDGSSLQEYPIPTPNSGPMGIIEGPTGDPWFTENQANQIGHNFVQIG